MKKIFARLLNCLKKKFDKSKGLNDLTKETELSQREIVYRAIFTFEEWFTSRQLINKINENFYLTPIQVYRVLSKMLKKGLVSKNKINDHLILYKWIKTK